MKKLSCLALGLALFSAPNSSFAFGKQPTEPPPEEKPQPAEQQARPYRFVHLAHVTTPAFYFPNGVRADFNADLDKIIETGINGSQHLRTQNGAEVPRLLITGGVTNLEMDVMQLNFKIGWNQNGPLPISGTNATGEVDLRLSALSMDFKVYDRVTGRTYLAAYTNEQLANLKISVKVNLETITSSLDVLYKTKMADAIRLATADVMKKLEGNADFDLLPWQATVIGLDGGHSFAAFGAGARVGVKAGDVYTIYSACESPAGGECFSRFLADVKTERVGAETAEAVPLTDRDSLHGVRTGDVVYVKSLTVAPLR